MGELVAVYIFGSVGRGEHDERSDLDLLAVVKDGAGRLAEHHVLGHVPPELRHLKPGISWYGQNRLRQMFNNGELFAWHLAFETIPLYEAIPFLKILGQPNPYQEMTEDVNSFHNILRGIPDQLKRNRFNAIYETGLIYVCVRNISMAASWLFCDRPDFSRYSAFHLGEDRKCPINTSEYDITMACRMAAQRGLVPPPGVDAGFTMSIYDRLDPWIGRIREQIREQSDGKY
jgi:hypothetical protein